jgi:SAM-dependent methyltransferase/uncharacterized protein YbaR (Trm112 family)
MSESTLTDLLRCPLCGSTSWRERDDGGALCCSAGHEFPVRNGVPVVMPDAAGWPTSEVSPEKRGNASEPDDVRSIHHSFSREWSHFIHDEDRVWGATSDEKLAISLRELDSSPTDIKGKLVLDAGCGHGLLSNELAKLGARVVGADISDSVFVASRQFGTGPAENLSFMQTDLTNPPLRPGSFDVVFSGGVLHHNPDTRKALDAIAPLVAPGGSIYVWLYWQVPGLAYRLKSAVRKVVAPMPEPAKHAFVRVWVLQSVARKHVRRLTGRAQPGDERTWREQLVTLLDHYTPRYRWEHTPDELDGWYRELGFTDVELTKTGTWGFGMLARRPAAGESRPATTERVAA